MIVNVRDSWWVLNRKNPQTNHFLTSAINQPTLRMNSLCSHIKGQRRQWPAFCILQGLAVSPSWNLGCCAWCGLPCGGECPTLLQQIQSAGCSRKEKLGRDLQCTVGSHWVPEWPFLWAVRGQSPGRSYWDLIVHTHVADGKDMEGALGGSFLLSSLSFLFLTFPPDWWDKRKRCVRLSRPGDFLRVLCVVLFEKRQNSQTKHSCIGTKVQRHGWSLPFHSQSRVSQMNPSVSVQTMGSPGSRTWSEQWARGQAGQWEGRLCRLPARVMWPAPSPVNRQMSFPLSALCLPGSNVIPNAPRIKAPGVSWRRFMVSVCRFCPHPSWGCGLAPRSGPALSVLGTLAEQICMVVCTRLHMHRPMYF